MRLPPFLRRQAKALGRQVLEQLGPHLEQHTARLVDHASGQLAQLDVVHLVERLTADRTGPLEPPPVPVPFVPIAGMPQDAGVRWVDLVDQETGRVIGRIPMPIDKGR